MAYFRTAFFLLFLMASSQPLRAEFGNRFIANKRIPIPLETLEKKISYRFTCQEDMSLTAASVFCVEAIRPPAYQVSLQEDRKGLPSGEPLAASSYVPLPQSWSTVPLNPVPLRGGKTYHLVLEHTILRGGGHPVGVIGLKNFASFLSTDFMNRLHPNDGSPDPQANTLLFEKGRWRELDQEPVYAVFGAGEKAQGNPYDQPGARPIFGGTGDKTLQVLQGESLHFHCGFAATSLVIRVKKQGNPRTPLNFLVLKHLFLTHKTIPIYHSLALAPDKASSDFQWVTIGIEAREKTNFSPECWFLVFQTDSGKAAQTPAGCEDCYLLSDVGNSGGLADAAKLTFDGGPHLSRAVYSIDGGDPFHWRDDFERDANVLAIGPDCPPPLHREFDPIPTPRPLEENLEFQP